MLRVSASIINVCRPAGSTEIPTKNRRVRTICARRPDPGDPACPGRPRSSASASSSGVRLVDDPYVFTDSVDGSEPWKPDTCRSTSVDCASASASTISTSTTCASSWRPTARRWASRHPGRDACRPRPAIAAKHYSGRVSETDRALATAVASLIAPPGSGWLPRDGTLAVSTATLSPFGMVADQVMGWTVCRQRPFRAFGATNCELRTTPTTSSGLALDETSTSAAMLVSDPRACTMPASSIRSCVTLNTNQWS